MEAPPLIVTWQLLSIVSAVGVFCAGLAWFIANEFRKNRHIFYQIISLHNREDDDRFEMMSNDIWRIHLRNAQRDGDNPPERKTFPRRRYLQEVENEVTS